MAVDHLVVLKFKPETPTTARAAVISGLQKLRQEIPAIIDLTVGETFTQRGQGFQLGLFVRLKDRTALDHYQDHPAHQKVVQELVKPYLAEIIAIDYEH